jgi:hypothetical protein
MFVRVLEVGTLTGQFHYVSLAPIWLQFDCCVHLGEPWLCKHQIDPGLRRELGNVPVLFPYERRQPQKGQKSGNNTGTSNGQKRPKSSYIALKPSFCKSPVFSNIRLFKTACRSSVGGPEKAGVGGSI